MTKGTLTALAMMAGVVGSTGVHAAEPSDSTKVRELEEVSVEASNQKAYIGRTVYHPTKQQKKFAMNGIQLISLMGIPQLRADITGGTVSTSFGEEVSLFINSMPAEKADIDGIRMDDVQNVEYLMNPTDPRFRGARYAVNFIVRIPEYGGYTKLSLAENLISPYYSYASVFSKFSYRRMVFDAFASTNNQSLRGEGTAEFQTFRFPDPMRREVIIDREKTPDRTRGSNNSYPVSFRATYNSNRLNICNTIGFSHSSMSANQDGHLIVSQFPGTMSTYTDNRKFRNNAISYSGDFFLIPAMFWSMNLELKANYSHNNRNTGYLSSLTAGDGILQNAHDDSFNISGNLTTNRQFGKHNVSLNLSWSEYHTKVRYHIPSYLDKFRIYHYGAYAAYRVLIDKVSISGRAGWFTENNVVNGQLTRHSYPYGFVSIGWLPAGKHQFNLSYSYASTSPDGNSRTANIFQSDEFLWRTGNPDIHSSHQTVGNFSYTWLPSNRFNMTAIYSNYCSFRRITTIYSPYEGKGVISQLANDGNSFYNTFIISLMAKFFSGKLQVTANPAIDLWNATGVNSRHLASFHLDINPTLFLGDFYISIRYATPQRRYAENGTVTRNWSEYGLAAGWAKNGFQLQARILNIFDSDRISYSSYFRSRWYTHTQSVFNSGRRSVSVSAVYTFGYGKNVQRGNEIGEQSGAPSGIF